MRDAMDCIVCGTCVADILVRPVPLSEPVGGGRLFHVEPIEATTGGIVCNTGIAMRRLGMRVAAASLVGADAWGELVRSRLTAEGIDCTAVESHPQRATRLRIQCGASLRTNARSSACGAPT